jgi:hypothetical protein
VTIVLRHNADIDLNMVEYRDAISFDELKAIAAFVSAHPDHMQRDSLNIVVPDANLDTVQMAELDALFAHYRDLYAPLHFEMLRRSAWICQSEAAAGHVRHWLGGDTRNSMRSAVRQFESLAEAGEWLVLNDAEIEAAGSGEGFAEIVRFQDSPTRLRFALR